MNTEIPKLPPRRTNVSHVPEMTNKAYKLSELIGKSEDFILNSCLDIFVDNVDILKANFEEFKRIISIKSSKSSVDVYCSDYESLLFLEKNPIDNKLYYHLVDDGLNKDRSYIDLDRFERITFKIPLIYTLWGVKSSKDIDVNCFRFINDLGDKSFSLNGNESISLENLRRFKELALKLKEKVSNGTDIEKCLVVSDYIQDHVQFVQDRDTKAQDGIYHVDYQGKEVTHKIVSSAETIINESFGICMAFSNATSLLLNNPIMNVDIRSVSGGSHAWNVVTIPEGTYFIDNSWAVTRNPNRVDNALKATKFTNAYLLFGSKTASLVGQHVPNSYLFNKQLEEDDFDREKLSQIEKNMGPSLKLVYDNKLIFPSSKIENK